MWRTSLPTNLSNKSTSRLYGALRDHKRGFRPRSHGSDVESCAEVGRWGEAVNNLVNWLSVYSFMF